MIATREIVAPLIHRDGHTDQHRSKKLKTTNDSTNRINELTNGQTLCHKSKDKLAFIKFFTDDLPDKY